MKVSKHFAGWSMILSFDIQFTPYPVAVLVDGGGDFFTLLEVKIGAMLKEIPKTSGGVNQYNKEENSTKVEKSKMETTKELGFTKHQVSEFQRMASHEDIVLEAIAEAKELEATKQRLSENAPDREDV